MLVHRFSDSPEIHQLPSQLSVLSVGAFCNMSGVGWFCTPVRNPHVTDYFKNIEESFLEILNFRLGKEPVARSNAESLGRLNFDSGLHGGVGRRERGVPVPNGNSPEVGCGR